MLWCGSKYHPPVTEPHRPCRTTSKVCDPIVCTSFLAENWSYTTDISALFQRSLLTHLRSSCNTVGHFNTEYHISDIRIYQNTHNATVLLIVGYMVNWLTLTSLTSDIAWQVYDTDRWIILEKVEKIRPKQIRKTGKIILITIITKGTQFKAAHSKMNDRAYDS